MASRNLHGRIKRFWAFVAITSLMAFVSNYSVQFFTSGEVDLNNAFATSLTIGVILAMVMSTSFITRLFKHEKRE